MKKLFTRTLKVALTVVGLRVVGLREVGFEEVVVGFGEVGLNVGGNFEQ